MKTSEQLQKSVANLPAVAKGVDGDQDALRTTAAEISGSVASRPYVVRCLPQGTYRSNSFESEEGLRDLELLEHILPVLCPADLLRAH